MVFQIIIDGHAHFIGEFANGDKLIPLMDKLGVDKVVLCPGEKADVEFTFKLPRISYSKFAQMGRMHMLGNIFYLRPIFKNKITIDNEAVYSLIQKHPSRLIQFYWSNPNDTELMSKLEKDFEKMSFKGIKLHQCMHKFSNLDESMKQISKFAEEKKLPIFIHLYNFKEAKRLVKLAKEHPKTNYIIGHLMGLETIARHGKELQNVYFDISTYYIVSNRRIKNVMKKFGDDKVLLGTDSPLGDRNLENNLAKVRKMDITDKQKDKILGENISRLLRL